MWLRSQNKEMLINANNIRIISDSRSYDIICDFYDGDYYYLGEYSTKEKAMKVMDMIHNQIMLGSLKYEDIKSNDDTQRWLKSEFVFQTPKDEEVE